MYTDSDLLKLSLTELYKFTLYSGIIKYGLAGYIALIDHSVALQTDHPELMFFQA